uniref:XIAP associated factor 1 n=1 Tax=Spermophilus dauricus TaxID=99837 RepID=A0A8C9NZ54_SPEDA
MEGDFQVCGNCRRSVASDHFTLHEAHCLRFLVLCPECEEPIPKSKMKEHFENEHQQVRGSGQDQGFLFQGSLNILSRFLTRESKKGGQTSIASSFLLFYVSLSWGPLVCLSGSPQAWASVSAQTRPANAS